jgi:hypothetical protein
MHRRWQRAKGIAAIGPDAGPRLHRGIWTRRVSASVASHPGCAANGGAAFIKRSLSATPWWIRVKCCPTTCSGLQWLGQHTSKASTQPLRGSRKTKSSVMVRANDGQKSPDLGHGKQCAESTRRICCSSAARSSAGVARNARVAHRSLATPRGDITSSAVSKGSEAASRDRLGSIRNGTAMSRILRAMGCHVRSKQKAPRKSLLLDQEPRSGVFKRACGTRACGCRFRSCRPGPRRWARGFQSRWRSWRASALCRRCRP